MSYAILSGEQIRAARAFCRIEQAELARVSGLSLQTIKRLEGFQGPIEATTRTLSALAEAFFDRGIVFDLQVGAGPGLRLLDARRPGVGPGRFSSSEGAGH